MFIFPAYKHTIMFENAQDVLVSANSTLPYTTDEMISMGFLFVISTIGSFGLVVILYASLFYRHSPHGMLIISLCLSSLMVCLNGTVAGGINLGMGGLMSGQPGLFKCKTESFIALVASSLSMVSLALVAGERYFVILGGVNNHSRQTIIAILITWIYAVVYASTTLISGENFRLATGRATCVPNCDMTTMFPLCLFAAAANTMTISAASHFYFKLYLYYKNSNRSREVDNSLEKEQRLFKKFTAIILLFSLFTTPFFVVFGYEAFTSSSALPILGHITINLLNLNHAITPYLLYTLDPSIRQQVDQVFGTTSIYATLFHVSQPSSKIKVSSDVRVVDLKKAAALASTVVMEKSTFSAGSK